MQISFEKPFILYIESFEEYAILEEQHFGLCINCGTDHYCCEPDAAGYVCESCGAKTVFGLGNLLLQQRIDFSA